MKRRIGILIGIVLVLLCTYALADVEINDVNFPDGNFRNTVSAFDLDGNGTLSDDEIAAVQEIDCSRQSVSDIKGIEFFTALETLYCHENQITSLDVSKNTALKMLSCDINSLTSLDVSRNTALKRLDCAFNDITSLDVSKNTALEKIDCTANQIYVLDLSANTALKDLTCQNCELSSLDLSANTKLTDLDCSSNQLAVLDVSGNTKLKYLVCAQNNLEQLDVSKVPKLNNLVRETEPAEDEKSLLWSKRSPSGNYSVYLRVSKDVNVITGEVLATSDVELNETNFPDEKFREAAENFDSDCDGYLSEEEIAQATAIVCAESGISSMQGIEYFTALQVLRCHGNQLTSLDVSKNTALIQLYCSSNELTSLNVSGCPEMNTLNCCNNKLTALDLSGNTALSYLDCQRNQLTALDVSANPAIETLFCTENRLTSLDVSKCTALQLFLCDNNQLTSLNVSGCTAMTGLSCHTNQLTSLDVSTDTALVWLFCHTNRLTSLDVSKNKVLVNLQCQKNNLKKLDVIQVPALAAVVKETEPMETDGVLVWQKGNDDGSIDAYLTVDKGVEVIAEKIKTVDISKAKVTAIKAQVYTGKAIKPTVIVKYDNKKLTIDKDYTVTYKNNKKIGKATVTITGKGNFTGKKTVRFDIIPKAVKLSSLTAGKKELTVKWAKGSGITGYEIQYSLKKNFKDAKIVTVKKAATTKTVLKNLKAKKTYYVRIRTYKTVNGTKYYSAWSAIRNKKTK